MACILRKTRHASALALIALQILAYLTQWCYVLLILLQDFEISGKRFTKLLTLSYSHDPETCNWRPHNSHIKMRIKIYNVINLEYNIPIYVSTRMKFTHYPHKKIARLKRENGDHRKSRLFRSYLGLRLSWLGQRTDQHLMFDNGRSVNDRGLLLGQWIYYCVNGCTQSGESSVSVGQAWRRTCH